MSEFKNSPIEDFDWEAFERGETAGDKTREELTKTYDESLNTVKDKEVTEGTVISINKREVVVNIGYKSDGIISINEFRYNPDLKVGDKVEVFIENQESVCWILNFHLHHLCDFIIRKNYKLHLTFFSKFREIKSCATFSYI